MRLLLKCNPGLEDVTALEAVEEFEGKASIVEERRGHGRVLLNLESTSLRPLFAMRSIHSASIIVSEVRVGYGREALQEIYSAAKSSGLHRYIPLGGSFAVRGERIGEGHSYTSLDVAGVVGKAIQDAYREEYGATPEVRLGAPSIAVAAEVDLDVLRLGLIVVGERSGHRRGYRVYDHPAALKPTLAYGLIRLTGVRDSTVVMDPMCGGGTVAVEAALLFEDARVICLDKNPRHIAGAMRNAAAARVADRIEFIVGDARRLEEAVGEATVDYAVSNPPYGIRHGDPVEVRRLYTSFLPSLYASLKPGGKAAIVTTESEHAIRVARRTGFHILEIRRVRHGDLWVSLIVFEKPGDTNKI